MRKRTAAVLLLVGGMLIGGMVFRAPLADAAQAVLQVNVVNPTTSPVPVRQQGPADVNVTNGSLAVTVPAQDPVTSGGQRLQVDSGQTSNLGSDITVSALVVQFRDGATEILFRNDGSIVARFPGPGPLVFALNQPIAFDAVQCSGPAGGFCDVGWAGSAG
jgi:hypothetical protein